MNGRSPRAFFSFMNGLRRPDFFLLARLRHAVRPGTGWTRLYAALMLSFALHAAVVAMPYFGTSTMTFRPSARGEQKPGPGRNFDVRLVRKTELKAAGAGASVAQPSEPAAPARSHGAGVLPMPGPTYFTTDQLTKPPQPRSEPRLDVPLEVARRVSGKVVLRLLINELGSVESAEVESSNLPLTVSGTAAEAFGKVRFDPGEIDGKQVRTLMRIEVIYINGKRRPP
jgi:hypothetical protein